MGRWFKILQAAMLASGVAASSGCILHRNLLLRWHLEFDADKLPDACVPECADNPQNCRKPSKLRSMTAVEGEPAEEISPPRDHKLKHVKHPYEGPARFHPVPTKPVFKVPDEQVPPNEPSLPDNFVPIQPREAPLTPEEMRELERFNTIDRDRKDAEMRTQEELKGLEQFELIEPAPE